MYITVRVKPEYELKFSDRLDLLADKRPNEKFQIPVRLARKLINGNFDSDGQPIMAGRKTKLFNATFRTLETKLEEARAWNEPGRFVQVSDCMIRIAQILAHPEEEIKAYARESLLVSRRLESSYRRQADFADSKLDRMTFQSDSDGWRGIADRLPENYGFKPEELAITSPRGLLSLVRNGKKD